MAMLSTKYKTFNIKENTSKHLLDEMNKEFAFDFDPCPENPTFNGLEADWKGSIYCNPPYGKAIRAWLEKGLSEIKRGNADSIVYLLPAYPDVKWFHEIVLPIADEIRFLKGRLKFGSHNQSAPFASMLVIFRRK